MGDLHPAWQYLLKSIVIAVVAYSLGRMMASRRR
jgi:hypothetical protein